MLAINNRGKRLQSRLCMRSSSKINQIAPKFKVMDVFGRKINLADYTEGYSLLVFLRYSGCPWCNLAIHRLSLEYKRLKKDKCQIIAFVQSDKENIIKHIFDRHEPKPQFPIIADHQMKIYEKYGVDLSIVGTLGAITAIPEWVLSVRKLGFKQTKIDGNLFLVPAWFLINNTTGKIVKSERGVSFFDHANLTGIYESLTFNL